MIPNNETKHFSNETIYLKLLDRVAKVNFIGTGDVFIDVVNQGDPDAGENIYHFYLTKHDDIDVAVEFPNLTITIGIVGLEALIMKEYSGPLVGEVTLNLS